MYKVVTTSKTKMTGTQMSNMHGDSKAVNQNPKPKIQVKREGISKSTHVVPKSLSHSQRIVWPFLPGIGPGRAGVTK